jgi:hypothetical protein
VHFHYICGFPCLLLKAGLLRAGREDELVVRRRHVLCASDWAAGLRTVVEECDSYPATPATMTQHKDCYNDHRERYRRSDGPSDHAGGLRFLVDPMTSHQSGDVCNEQAKTYTEVAEGKLAGVAYVATCA